MFNKAILFLFLILSNSMDREMTSSEEEEVRSFFVSYLISYQKIYQFLSTKLVLNNNLLFITNYLELI